MNDIIEVDVLTIDNTNKIKYCVKMIHLTENIQTPEIFYMNLIRQMFSCSTASSITNLHKMQVQHTIFALESLNQRKTAGADNLLPKVV